MATFMQWVTCKYSVFAFRERQGVVVNRKDMAMYMFAIDKEEMIYAIHL